MISLDLECKVHLKNQKGDSDSGIGTDLSNNNSKVDQTRARDNSEGVVLFRSRYVERKILMSKSISRGF